MAKLESAIAGEQATLDQLDEHYNQAEIALAATRRSLSVTNSHIRTAGGLLAHDRNILASDAVQSYMSGSTSGAVSSLFAAPSNQSQIQDLYQRLGARQVSLVVRQVQSTEHALGSNRTRLLVEQRAESKDLRAANTARKRGELASELFQATLRQAQRTLAAEFTMQLADHVIPSIGGPGGTATLSTGGQAQAPGLAAVQAAVQFLGVPYVWGGASMAGVDCSGLVMLAWAQAGVSLSHSAADQYLESTPVSLSNLEPGDLLFYDFGGTGIDHVVMYVGPTLDGQPTPYGIDTIIQAAYPGTTVSFEPFWAEGLVGAARP
ncbi:MAG: C40 family peptidase [Acidimicrobiales bacterium]